ncbi:DUF1622 domain-containing protein [Stratiformator vulcanicus]|nr:DUF1622 domain-containing protein [Stratiformator vulcanicus]
MFDTIIPSLLADLTSNGDAYGSWAKPSFVHPLAEWAAAIVETVGLTLLVVLSFHALLRGIWRAATTKDSRLVFRETRSRLIRGILLGLELLVAADIIHTVAVELSFTSVGVLAIIVAIRTFLSFTLEVEMTGKWPWQQEDGEEA